MYLMLQQVIVEEPWRKWSVSVLGKFLGQTEFLNFWGEF